MLRATIAVVSLATMLTPAAAGPDSDIVGKFGLFGTWAVDCSIPPSDANYYQEYAPSTTGYPTRAWYAKKGYPHTSEMRNVRIVGPDRLAYLDVRKTDGDLTNIVVAKIGEQTRSLESVDPKDKKVWVKDGKFLASGEPTPLFQRCLGK